MRRALYITMIDVKVDFGLENKVPDSSQYGGRGFEKDELRQTKDIHFQKADDM